MNSKKNNEEEWEMLGHDPAPGYTTAFYVAISLAVLYLIYAFSAGFGSGGAH
ncbi:MAG: hypothetical protein GY707_14540 [Desulfobacteraceae bacterium]|nr:hypothetical protein [Desulfobacteraceae bacterium]